MFFNGVALREEGSELTFSEAPLHQPRCFKAALGVEQIRVPPPGISQSQVTSCRDTSCPAKDYSLPTFSEDS